MRPNKCKQICPHCGSSKYTNSEGSGNYYCSKCNKYFKAKSTRTDFSKAVKLVLNTLIGLFYTPKKTKISIEMFKKLIALNQPQYKENVFIKFLSFKQARHINENDTLDVDTDISNAILLIRKGNEFDIVRGLNVRQKINFNDASIYIFENERQKLQDIMNEGESYYLN